MNRAVLFSAAAAIAILSGETSASASPPRFKPSTVLWNQNANFGGNVNSQNTAAAADDFTIPSGQTWHIAQVDVSGAWFNGTGPASSQSVTFYANKNGKPGRTVRGPYTLNCTDNAGSFQCTLPVNGQGRPAVKLGAGTWWVSVVANCSFDICGEWNWTENTEVTGHQAVWEDPGGTNCSKWGTLQHCFGGAPADLAFDLVGTK